MPAENALYKLFIIRTTTTVLNKQRSMDNTCDQVVPPQFFFFFLCMSADFCTSQKTPYNR